tara:strand:- start:3958 stop:7293 length:3336 start_codon:yes stop_codon:yes gene_type:complete
VAQVKNYGLIGVGASLQLGKQGPKLKGNADASLMQIVAEDNATLTRLQGANATAAADFVTKAQLDAQGSATDGFSLTLGNIDATGDGDWHITPNQGEYAGNSTVTRQGAVTSLSNTEKVSDAIDKLNEATLNIYNNTFVRDVDYTTNVSSGGAPLAATLTISTTGNPNRYTINWGDGTTTTATTDSTPSHTYSNNALSPFDVTVTAFHNSGAGEGSTTSLQKENFITLYTSNPVADFGFFAASSGGGEVTQIDDGTALYFENQTTNIGSASATYKVEWGDGSGDNTITADTETGGTQGSRLSHTFATSTETDQQRTVKLTLLTHTTADPSTVPNNTTAVVNVFDTHTPTVSLDDNSGINETATSGHPVTFTNTTESGVGTFAAMGIQYRYVWGDGTTSTVNVGSGSAGDTSGTIDHTFALSGGQQSSGTAVDFVGNIEVISNHTSSPFKSSNFTVHVEPDLRATVTGTSVSQALSSSNDNDRVLYKGTDLSGTNRAIVTVDNTTQNANAYVYAWGDGSSNDNVTESGSPAGSVGGANITHDYLSQNAGSYTLTMTGSGQPDLTVQSDNDTVVFSLENLPAAPTSVSGKSLTLSTSAQDTSKLAHGATNNVGGISTGTSLNGSTARRYDTTTSVSTSTISDAYRSDSGTVSALVDGSADGNKAFSTSTGETGTFTSLVITAEGDAYNEISSTTYPQNFFQVFSGRVTKNISSLATGVHSLALSHSTTGATNNVYIVKDNVTSAPTVNVGSANLAEHTAGSKRYVSGVPYYNSGSPKVKLESATVSNLVGEAYLDSSSIFAIASGTNLESTSGSTVQQEFRSYSDIDGSSTMLNSGVPIAQTGVASPYALGDITVDITTSNVAAVEAIKFRATNVNGTGSYTSETSEKIQVWTASPTFDEENIAVSDSLGAGFDDDGKRITGFGSASDTPAIAGSTDFYTASAWTGAETIAGTTEAVVRWNTLQHFDTNLSSGYLPVGPDLATGRSGTQYFTFAFRRTTMANFVLRLTGTVSGLFIAAPGTNIDSTSGTNGWLTAGSTYAGAGTPGSNTGAGGNGSDGCAFTSGDRIIDGASHSNDTFTMTLGDQNGTDATGNNILVRIKLEDGDSLTALSVE